MKTETARTYPDPAGSFAEGQTPAPTPVGVFPLTLCLTVNRLLAMLSVLYEGGAAQGYGYLGDHNRDLINALSWMQDNNAPCLEVQPPTAPPETIIKETIKTLYVAYPELCEEMLDELREETDMSCKPVKFNNVWYLTVPCGDCGQVEYIPLGKGAAIDPTTNAPLPAESSGITGNTAYPASGVTVDCYASKAVDYLLNRFLQFIQTTQGLSVLVLDEAFLFTDEVLDAAAIFFGVTSGEGVYESIRELAYSQIEAVLSGNRAKLINAWTYTNEVTRADLQAWIKSAPQLTGGVLLQAFMSSWVTVTRVPGLNRDLSLIANECKSGISFLNPPTTQAGFVLYEQAAYGIAVWENITLTNGVAVPLLLPEGVQTHQIKQLRAVKTAYVGGSFVVSNRSDNLSSSDVNALKFQGDGIRQWDMNAAQAMTDAGIFEPFTPDFYPLTTEYQAKAPLANIGSSLLYVGDGKNNANTAHTTTAKLAIAWLL